MSAVSIFRLHNNMLSRLPLSKYDGRVRRNDVLLGGLGRWLGGLYSSSHLFGPSFLFSPSDDIGY